MLYTAMSDKRTDSLMSEEEESSRVTLDMWLMFISIFLLTNARAKFENTLPSQYQDRSSQTYGWFKIFWNFSFIPFIYTFNMYFLYRDFDKKSQQVGGSKVKKLLPFLLFLLGYYIYDTAYSQKNSFIPNLFQPHIHPKLPWADLGTHPKKKSSKYGGYFIVDGWFAFARKMHHTGEMIMTLAMGLMCCNYGVVTLNANGTEEISSEFQFWALPFALFLITVWYKYEKHKKEEYQCYDKYGSAWVDYKKQVPNAFSPDLYTFLLFLQKDRMPLIR